MRSLAYLLAKYPGDGAFTLLRPREFRIGQDIKDYLSRHNVPFEEADTVEGCAA